ncbi:MAG: nucleotide sugar dehydrogenase [Myxococcales bacterium]|nr:nucleotide sugar dehydrogenase [Myxococcales bacterium]HRC55020.1 nucleotide sugar dehydrogenase [Kofleriaceae bacterium]
MGKSAAHDVCIVGGAGHVGAPLALVFAKHGYRTLIYDLNATALDTLAQGRMPFLEEGGEELLREVLPTGRLSMTSKVSDLANVPLIVLTIGTPIDEFHNPMLRVVFDCLDGLLPYLDDSQTLILRSTVFPGVTEHVQRYLEQRGKKTMVAFCPERVVQGHSLRELQTLPQIVSGTSPAAEDIAAKLFSSIAPKIVRMLTKEAEFAKLFSNAYRYIQFAATNQFYMMVEGAGLDYHRLLEGLKDDYPRARDLPTPGLSAGPCLHKDTLQLAAFANNQFGLGYAAMQVNEGLPQFMVSQLAKRHPLQELTVGMLGMAFKSDSDDIRSSLSYKLKKLLRVAARQVLTTDPFVKNDPDLLPFDEVVSRSDVLVLCVPHTAYKSIDLGDKPVFDIWNIYQKKTARNAP